MKTHPLPKPPPVDPAELSLPVNGHSLKAYFCAAALTGRIASQEDATFNCSMENIVDEAYTLGEMMFERYVEENLSAVRKFNKKVGL